MHGEHLPVGTDVYEAVAVAELAATMEDARGIPRRVRYYEETFRFLKEAKDAFYGR